ncbi:hypothetical protein LV457_18630 [Mycobacterium sp. MYCO198283]|uniref:hypothetical protein n=1 Tax=Mycobacterium sp. MYCO198283 TaxID=2883505 RepID=UPI001E42239D|nr:hypothetical protein [Mycobacterium sp. MYCO198283]MCG5434291.1 hypothetical protein [Mycobacterium sp. MYCO198283]
MAKTDDLPLPDYDQLSVGDLQHRIRSLDSSQLLTLIAYEDAHAGRPAVLDMLAARHQELDEGAEPSGGDPANTPPVSGSAGSSPVSQSTAAQGNTPLRHGVAYQTPARGKP